MTYYPPLYAARVITRVARKASIELAGILKMRPSMMSVLCASLGVGAVDTPRAPHRVGAVGTPVGVTEMNMISLAPAVPSQIAMKRATT